MENQKKMIDKIDDDYLISLSNKGIFNRSLKDLEVTSVEIELSEGMIKAKIGDGNNCEIPEDIKKFKCTCPSRSICKHVIMTLLYLKKNSALYFKNSAEDKELPEAKEKECEDDYSEALNIKPEIIEKLIGEKDYRDILLRYKYGVRSEIEEKSFLIIRFVEEEIVVRFPKNNLIDGSFCSCKATQFCKHRGEALIHYQIAKKLENGSEDAEKIIKEYERTIKVDIKEDVLKEVKMVVREVLTTGLSRIDPVITDKMELTAVQCHSGNLSNLEKMMRTVKGETEMFLNKNAGFSKAGYMEILSRIYVSAIAIENNLKNGRDEKVIELAGKHKSDYFEIPSHIFYGVGLEKWRSKSGYEGVTTYFFSGALRQIFTFTNVNPTFYGDMGKNRVSSKYLGSPPWDFDGTYEEFAKSVIELKNGKINENNRISSSERSNATRIRFNSIENMGDIIKGYIFDDWNILHEKVNKSYEYTIFEREENGNMVFLKPVDFSEGLFDKIAQEFRMELIDINGERIVIKVKYSDFTDRMIKRLEKHVKIRVNFFGMFFGRVYKEEGEFFFFPICGYKNGEMENLTV